MLALLRKYKYFELLQRSQDAAIANSYGEKEANDLVTHDYKLYEDPHTQMELSKVLLRHLRSETRGGADFVSLVLCVLAQMEAKSAKDKKKIEFQFIDEDGDGFITLDCLR